MNAKGRTVSADQKRSNFMMEAEISKQKHNFCNENVQEKEKEKEKVKIKIQTEERLNTKESEEKGLPPAGIQESEEANEIKTELLEADDEAGVPLWSSVFSAALFLVGNVSAAPPFRLAKWLASVRGRRANVHFSEESNGAKMLFCNSDNDESVVTSKKSATHVEHPETPAESSLWDRLGKAVSLDIDSSNFSWDRLTSLHHTEHTSSADQSEDELNKPLEVTVNSGGVVFFAVFDLGEENSENFGEGVAVMKFSSSRMATQSERLGYEFANRFGVMTPQARVIHNCSNEWQSIKDAVEMARNRMHAEGDEMGKNTCTELLEALELSRCLLLMGYVHGCPLFENPSACSTQEAAQKTAASLGRLLILDLVLRNEDRLPCRQLGWRGNPANLLFTDKLTFVTLENSQQESPEAFPRRNRSTPGSQRERRFYSVDGRTSPDRVSLVSQMSDNSDLLGSIAGINSEGDYAGLNDCLDDFFLVAIDSGVPRRPPAGKRNSDQLQYPNLVELILNSASFSSNLLYELSGERIGTPTVGETTVHTDSGVGESIDQGKVVQAFRSGFRAALREMQSLHVFLLKLHQKLEILLRTFMQVINKYMPNDSDDKEESGVCESTGTPQSNSHSHVPDREMTPIETHGEGEDVPLDTARTPRGVQGRSSSRSVRDGSPDTASPFSRDNWSSKQSKINGDPLRSIRMTMKLKDLSRNGKCQVDAELNKDLESWNQSLKAEAIKLCQENNFHTGFFEGSDIHSVVDSYELKIRLEHLLERMALISQAAATERPSRVTNSLYIGGALAASSIHTLQYLGISHILCLCPNELGQFDTQYTDLFEYRNFAIYDTDDANISILFEAALEYIDSVENNEGKILVHCFEGKSRSATVVLAYLMLRKNYTLQEAWTHLKRVHRRAQPNDGFMRTLMDLDKRLHGKASMDWRQRKPIARTCPICLKNVGISSSSLKLHLQKAHRRISSGSVDSYDMKELKHAIESVRRNQ